MVTTIIAGQSTFLHEISRPVEFHDESTRLDNGDQITHYGILNGATLLRKIDLEPVSLTVNNGAQAFPVRVTPVIEFDPNE